MFRKDKSFPALIDPAMNGCSLLKSPVSVAGAQCLLALGCGPSKFDLRGSPEPMTVYHPVSLNGGYKDLSSRQVRLRLNYQFARLSPKFYR